jgi:hypothetical protein
MSSISRTINIIRRSLKKLNYVIVSAFILERSSQKSVLISKLVRSTFSCSKLSLTLHILSLVIQERLFERTDKVFVEFDEISLIRFDEISFVKFDEIWLVKFDEISLVKFDEISSVEFDKILLIRFDEMRLFRSDEMSLVSSLMSRFRRVWWVALVKHSSSRKNSSQTVET